MVNHQQRAVDSVQRDVRGVHHATCMEQSPPQSPSPPTTTTTTTTSLVPICHLVSKLWPLW